MFKKTILKNGLRIITVPLENTQAVTILVLVKTGSKYEKKEINGISHFLEHLFFKGTKKRPNPQIVAETLDKVGGIYNAFTSEDYTGYFAKVASQHFDLALDWVSDIFLNSILPKNEIEKERGVIIEEINMYSDNPMTYVQIIFSKLLYGDQPAGWPIAGNKETIKKINRQQLFNYRKSQYIAKNTLISIAGKIDSKEAENKIKKYFSKIKNFLSLKKPKVIEKQEKPTLILHSKETDQTHICLGVRGYSLFHPKRYAFEILGIILGGMMSSRLFQKVREKLGVAYYIHTDTFLSPDNGYLVTRAGIDNKKIEEAISAILKEYKSLIQKSVSNEELKKAKDYIKGVATLGLETSETQASFYGIQELLKNEILTPKEIFDMIDKVTSRDIQAVARDIFKSQKLNLALIGPFKEKEKFEKILNYE